MKALVCYDRAPGCMELRDLPEPKMADDEMLVEVAFAGICGSDLKLYHGNHPHATPPIVPGHEFSGTIARVGSAIKKFRPGDRITGLGKVYPEGTVVGDDDNINSPSGTKVTGLHLDGAFARYLTIKERFALKLPDEVSLRAAAVCEPLGIALNAVMERARLQPFHRVLVSGPGPVGLLVVQVARLYGAEVMVAGTSVDEGRLALARTLGATETVDVQKQDLADAVARFTGGQGMDAAFECAGAAGSVNNCLASLRWYGQHVQVGTFPGGKQVEVLMNHVLFKELTISGVYGHVWSYWAKGLRLLSQRRISTEAVASHTFPLSRWQEAFDVAERREGVKVLITPED